MRSQLWAEGQARLEMTAPHSILRGKSSASVREGDGSVNVWQLYQKMVTVLSFEKTFAFIRDPPTILLLYDLHSSEHLVRWTEYFINSVTA